jgi:uncharacterized phiE125 gp8 family phage protein
MNFTGPWSDYYPDGFPGWAIGPGRERVEMRKLTTSTGFPIAFDEILADLRVDSDDEANTIKRLARAAAAFLEKRTGIAVLQGTYEAKFSGWCYRPWEFMRTPLRVIKEISVLDGTASPPTWEDVAVDKFFVTELAKSFLVVPLQGVTLPVVWAPFHGIRVRFNAGFDNVAESGQAAENESGEGDQAELPIADDIRTTLTMLTAHFYENRELFAADKLAQVEASAGSLLASNRQFW